MTYNEFKQQLEKLVIGYAMECKAELNVNVIVKVDEEYSMSGSECVSSSKKYEARTTTEIG